MAPYEGSPVGPDPGFRDRDSENADLRLYREHYEGLTRGQLQLRDSALYQRLRKASLLGRIPTKKNFAPSDGRAWMQTS